MVLQLSYFLSQRDVRSIKQNLLSTGNSLSPTVVLISYGHTSTGSVAISEQQVRSNHNPTLTNILNLGSRALAITIDGLNFADGLS
jgi:hypothetical protein